MRKMKALGKTTALMSMGFGPKKKTRAELKAESEMAQKIALDLASGGYHDKKDTKSTSKSNANDLRRTKSLIEKPISHKKSTPYVGRSRLTSIEDVVDEIESKQNRSKPSTKGYHSSR